MAELFTSGLGPPYGTCEHMRQTADETLNPLRAAVDIYHGLSLTFECYGEIFANYTKENPQASITSFLGAKIVNDLGFFLSVISLRPPLIVFAFAIAWTIARVILVNLVFRPVGKWLGVQRRNLEKLCESCWKTTAYTIMWTYAFHIVFCRGYDFFQRPMQQFSDWSIEKPIPFDIELIYGLECSFYLHSVYATFFMDAWRKDSILMLVHHFVSMTLIMFSYFFRVVKIGVTIFVLNDISDIFLEIAKVGTYLRHRASGFSLTCSVFSDILSGVFALSWFINRLWFHLTIVWRAGALGVWVSMPVIAVPFHIFLNLFLASLYGFYVYWWWFIAVFIWRVATGTTGSAEDPREDEDKKAN